MAKQAKEPNQEKRQSALHIGSLPSFRQIFISPEVSAIESARESTSNLESELRAGSFFERGKSRTHA